jgi:hypothetical protein
VKGRSHGERRWVESPSTERTESRLFQKVKEGLFFPILEGDFTVSRGERRFSSQSILKSSSLGQACEDVNHVCGRSTLWQCESSD